MNKSPANPARGDVWYNWPGPGCDPQHQLTPDRFSRQKPYDVAIIGAGVVGCALAYELSQYHLKIVLIDKAFDVGEGTSKANSAIIHTGFDAAPDTLESQLVTDASRQWPALAAKLKIPFKPVSALMLALNEEQLARLPALYKKALANGVDDVELVTADVATRMEPHISPAVRGGLVVPRESIIDPFTTSIAYADVARRNGVDLVLGWEVSQIDDPAEEIKSVGGAGKVRIPSRFVINASGLGSRPLVDAYHGEPMDLNPRRGQFVVYDRDCAHLVNRILLPIPTEQTKGMLVSPTVFGNLLAGPTAEDLPPEDILATNTTCAGLTAVRESSVQMCPALSDQPIIATYAGLRCNCAQGSYWFRFNDGHPGMVTLTGIRSTGLTASISIAQHVLREMSSRCGLQLHQNNTAVNDRPEGSWPGWWRHPFDHPHQIRSRPDFGRIVCSCENISRGEVQDAIDTCPGAATLDGLKRRTRVLTGRCQGFNCGVTVAQMISTHFQIPLAHVTKRGPGSEFVVSGGEIEKQVRAIPCSDRTQLRPHYRVVIVGAGPAGIGVAERLADAVIQPVLLIDRAPEVGGVPAQYRVKRGGVPTFVVWSRGRVLFGQQFVDILRNRLARTSTQVCLECQVVDANRATRSLTLVSPSTGSVEIAADAVVFACGAREKTRSERGWIAGHRPARQFSTMQLLQLLDHCGALPMRRPAVIGSDLIAFSAAAKLKSAGSQEAIMLDQLRHPGTGVMERLYFRRWTRPVWRSALNGVTISDDLCVTQLGFDRHQQECDGVVISGELVPNSELIVAAGLAVSQPGRIPARRGSHELSEPGWFVAGAQIGGFHSAHWCYRDGQRTGKQIASYLRNLKSTQPVEHP